MKFDENYVISLFTKKFRVYQDDVGVYKIGDKYLVMSIDSFVKSSDAPLNMPYYSMGYKAVISSVSDLFVKGVYPSCLLISLGFSEIAEIELKNLRDGILKALSLYGLSNEIYKWDTNYSKDMFITVTSIGLSDKHPPSRKGAKIGDLIYVGDYFGLERLGLDILLGNIKREDLPLKLLYESIKRFLYPSPKFKKYIEIFKENSIDASIDSSDGLGRSLVIISKASKVGVYIDELPIHPILRKYKTIFREEYIRDIILNGGEEYIGIFIVKPEYKDLLDKQGFIYIGHIGRGEGIYYKRNEKYKKISVKGYLHTL